MSDVLTHVVSSGQKHCIADAPHAGMMDDQSVHRYAFCTGDCLPVKTAQSDKS